MKEVTLKLYIDVDEIKDVAEAKSAKGKKAVKKAEVKTEVKVVQEPSAVSSPKSPSHTQPHYRFKRSIISAKNLSRTYGKGHTQVSALKDVDLEVMRGEFLSVMGPSGSGKTTLLNLLGALDRPTGGHVSLDGVNTSTIPERKLFHVRREKVGFIFQTFYLVPTLTALENVLMPVLPVHANGEYKQRAEELLRKVGLEHRMRHKPAELSGGEQQRVAIARSLILDPPLVLADEPTGNLDSETGAEIFYIMQDLNEEQGVTFVIVTHDPRIAKETERVVYLKDGELSLTPSVDMNAGFGR